MKIMMDLNVLLDFLQNREPYGHTAAELVEKALRNRFDAVIPSHAATTLHYLIAKYNSVAKANETIDWLLGNFVIAMCDGGVLRRARSLPLADFEDAVVAASAERERCQAIATRNTVDFAGSPVPAIKPDDLLRQLAEKKSD